MTSMETTDSWTSKYRPKSLKAMVGQERAVSIVNGIIESKKVPATIMINGQTGTGKCLKGDTIINTQDGFFHIKELAFPEGYYPYKTNIVSPTGISKTAFSYKAEADTLTIITDKGLKISGTPEHKVMVVTKDLKFKWRTLRDIKTGEYIVGKTFKSNYLLPEKDKISAKFARMLGWYTANGGKNFIYTDDLYVVKKLFKAAKLFGEPKRLTQKSDKVNGYCIPGINFHYYFKHNSSDKNIPLAIRTSSKKVIHAFLTSYFECDSGVNNNNIEIVSASEKLIDQIQVILTMVYNIKTKKLKITKSAKNSNAPTLRNYYVLRLSGIDCYNFCKHFPTAKVARKYKKRFKNIQSKESCMYKYYPHIRKNLLKLDGFSYEFSSFLKRSKRTIGIYKKEEIMKELKKSKDCKIKKDIEKILSYSDDYHLVVEKYKSRLSKVYDVNIPKGHAFMANGLINHNTTLARLIAYQINELKYGEPTGDIIELDMGNEGNKEDIKNIINLAQYKPMKNFKVFILDECHLITKQAASALLKPLEDPPPRTVWICVTDQPEKVLPTIRGRSMIINLVQVPPEALAKRLKMICEKEKITFLNDKHLLTIAKNANAQPRAAIGLLQSVYYANKGSGDVNISEQLKTLLAETNDSIAARFLVAIYKNKTRSIPVILKSITNKEYISIISIMLYHNQFLIERELGVNVWVNEIRRWLVEKTENSKIPIERMLKIHSGLVSVKKELGMFLVPEDHYILAEFSKLSLSKSS